jgi:ribosomal protein L37AE/L43A
MIRWWEYLQTARAFKGADIAERTAIVEQRLASLRRSDAIRILAQAAIDGSPQVRRAAIRALANFNQPAATQLLAGAVLDEDLDVARAAAAALLARDWQPQKPLQQRRMHIAHLIQQSDQGVGEERRQALLALARIDDPLASCHAPEAVVRQVAEEAAPSSIGFLMQAARSHGQIAGAVAQGLERIVKKYRRQLPDARLQELSVLQDLEEKEAYTVRKRTEGDAGGKPQRSQTAVAVEAAQTRYRVKRRISCKAIRDAARQELARRAVEEEDRKKYFCPDCNCPLKVDKAHFGHTVTCSRCGHSHVGSASNLY